VIRIRYRDFSAGRHNTTGLHGMARRGGHGVTVYLVPGLTARERRAVLRRLRQEASRGFGPPLPLLALALALAADRVRAGAGIVASLIRLHPAVTLLPGAVVAAVMALFIVASAGRSAEFTPGPQGGLAVTAGGDVLPAVNVLPPSAMDRQLTTVDDRGPVPGGDGGQLLVAGQYSPGKHGHRGKGAARGWKAEARGTAEGRKARDHSGNGKGDGGPSRGPIWTAVSPQEHSARVPSAGKVGLPRDCPPGGTAGLRKVKGGVGVGDHGC
jgi:hypothetical protein